MSCFLQLSSKLLFFCWLYSAASKDDSAFTSWLTCVYMNNVIKQSHWFLCLEGAGVIKAYN